LALHDLPTLPSAASATGTAPPSKQNQGSLADEVAQLQKAKLALKGGHPGQALAELTTYAQRFPHPTLHRQRRRDRFPNRRHRDLRRALPRRLSAHPIHHQERAQRRLHPVAILVTLAQPARIASRPGRQRDFRHDALRKTA